MEQLEQAEIDNAAKVLMDAISTLFEKGDMAPLLTLVRYVKMMNEERYTPASWQPLKTALENAEAGIAEGELLADEVTALYNALRGAVENLVQKANPSGLEGAIAVVENILANREQYIPSTLEGLEEALGQAKALYGDANATQTEVDKMTGDLMALAMKVRKPANKAALKSALGYAGRLSGMNQAALAEAERVLADSHAPQEAVDAAKAAVEDAKASLKADGIAFDEGIKVGIMVETPASVFIIDQLAKHVEFFSIGTNDLIQYITATDRMNEKVQYLYDPCN